MTQEFSLDQKRTTILVSVFVVLLFLVFLAGYLSGTLVGLPESQQPSIAKKAAEEPTPKPSVDAIPVPQVVTRPVPEPEEEVAAEPEPEPEPIVAVPVEKLYSVQVGAFKTLARAMAQQEFLAEKGYQPYIYHGPNSKGAMWYTVRVGDFDDVDDAIMAAREFRALEGTSVALTHYDSLMMVRDENGRRIEIAPPAKLAKAVANEASAEISTAEKAEHEPVAEKSEPVSEDPEPVAEDPEPVTEEPEPIVAEPEPVAEKPEPVAEELEPVTAEPEPVTEEPERVAVEPEPGVEEPEMFAESPETIAPDKDSVARETGTEAAAGQAIGQEEATPSDSTPYRVTFSLPKETPVAPPAAQVDETASVGGLIVAAEAKQYSVQVGAFLNDNNAVKFAQKLRGYDYPAYVFRYTDTEGNAWSAVRIGDFEGLEGAKAAAVEFEAKQNITAIVTKIDGIKMILK